MPFPMVRFDPLAVLMNCVAGLNYWSAHWRREPTVVFPTPVWPMTLDDSQSRE
jgi:hypothetical protein